MNLPHNIAGWFEIPVTDMERAIAFYESVFEFKMERLNQPEFNMATFPRGENNMGSGGALILNAKNYKPSTEGVLIYFTAFSGDLTIELSRVEKAGGKILMPKRQISPDIGYMGLALDSEGNRIAFHNR